MGDADPRARPGRWSVEVFANLADDAPLSRRFVAHVFDKAGGMLPATFFAETALECRKRLLRFWTDEIARAATSRRDPAKARATLAANRALEKRERR